MHKEKVKIVYAGKTFIKGRKIAHEYRLLLENNATSETASIVLAKHIHNAAIGTIIEIEREGDTYYTGKADLVGKYLDDIVTVWSENSKCVQLQYESGKNYTKVLKTDYDKAIGILSNILLDLPRSQRRAFRFKIFEDLNR